jgi:hypothetical protein
MDGPSSNANTEHPRGQKWDRFVLGLNPSTEAERHNETVTNLRREPIAYPGTPLGSGLSDSPALSPAGILENRVIESTRFQQIGKKNLPRDTRREQQYSPIGAWFGVIEAEFK